MPGFAWEPKPGTDDDDAVPVAVLVPKDRDDDDDKPEPSGPPDRILYMREDDAPDLLTEVEAPEGFRFRVVPSPWTEDGKGGRDVVYLYGSSGAGKSHWLREYATAYHNLFPRRKIFLISALDKDATLDKIKSTFTRVSCKSLQTAAALKSVPRKYHDALVIVDDIEGLNPKAPKTPSSRGHAVAGVGGAIGSSPPGFIPSERDGVLRLLDAIATKGRHTNTSLLWAGHLPSDFNRSRIILSEAGRYVIYPHGCALAHLQRLLGNYGGVDATEVQRLRSSRDRSVVVGVRYPRYILSDSGVQLLLIKGAEATPSVPLRPDPSPRTTAPPSEPGSRKRPLSPSTTSDPPHSHPSSRGRHG